MKMLLLFGLTFIILVFLFFCKSRDKNAQKESETFWIKERESQFVPKKDISSLDYLTIPYSSLPFCYWTPGTATPLRLSGSAPQQTVPVPDGSPDTPEAFTILSEALPDAAYNRTSEHSAPLSEELAEAERELCMLADKRILNLTGISNTELRLSYGTANLEPLTAYDQNYTILIRMLQKWGALLVSAGRAKDAVTVLSYAVSIGSDIAGTYTLLARLYKEQDRLDKIEELKEHAAGLTTLMKPSILRDLEQLTSQE